SLGLVKVRPNGDGDERQQYGVDDSDHRNDETRDVVVGAAHVDGYITVKDDEPSNAATDGQHYDDRPDEQCGKTVDEVGEHPAVVGPMEKRLALNAARLPDEPSRICSCHLMRHQARRRPASCGCED